MERKRKLSSDEKQRQIQSVRHVKVTTDTKAAKRTAFLDKGHAWELRVDINRKSAFSNTVEANLRPYAVLASKQSKSLIAIKLSVQW